MYLAFIHIGRYDIKARRHLACVQNGITQLGDWRMETWQLALRARCHVSIRQSPSLCNAILNTCPCLLAIGSHRHVFTLAIIICFLYNQKRTNEYTLPTYDDVITWKLFPLYSPSETGGLKKVNLCFIDVSYNFVINLRCNGAHIVLL